MAADCTTLPYAATGAFSGLLTDYIAGAPALAPFYHRRPELAAIPAQIAEKQAAYPPEMRQRLVADLRAQYAELGGTMPPAVAANLDLLARDTTFTITTGHQLNLLTGPLYFVYKIVTAIKLSQDLKAAYPQHDFVPVYWLATEDHDFAEINSFPLFGKTYSWAGPGGAAGLGGPVGRLALQGLDEELLSQLPPEVPAAFREAYTGSQNLSEATRRLATSLFGEYGLVCLDADRPALKQALKPLLTKELTEQFSNQAVQATNGRLTAAGYKPQVFSRPLNLFLLTAEGKRERLELEAHAPAELLALAEAEPERFSPNVVLRPVYQEIIMPNLAYIGGGAEVAYWFQLKDVFAALGVPYPLVLPRNSAMYLSRANAGKLAKLGLSATDIFKPLAELKKQVGAQLGQEEISLAAQQQALAAAFEQVQELAQRLDPTLVKSVAAEAQKAAGSLAGLEKRLSKAAEAKHETAYAQLTTLKDKLFPDGGLQERTDNVLSILLNNPGFIGQLLACFEPLKLEFAVVQEG
ncbi:bacillithiol biosynthesis cysteine-adding enzyme BshC [Hymenobacter sp. UV11]|uniref:bacillithiol biosynthesis cysteine-adding enzyme BshC n=1 Tax=Hymenobacter sp. UV11 TaxID=1849735 RepID=UPI00105C30AD|nr:bacillithiol biosynthesis cysteine-adding enzyme BshC [Hymenobacter sp. UV11]TDN40082.1 bacillithiol biosynthesis cysteine-adding enzyme BshC [Hymenobacter sp. UV11]TFZ64001.1 bacillithiol biosynthesis cysteine-adding enzyme BshC [Hymenobacter sp. UV11]